jgi:hypothetical protein
MHPYLNETKHAVEGVFSLLSSERLALAKKGLAVKQMETRARELFEVMKRDGADSTDTIELFGIEESKGSFQKDYSKIELSIKNLRSAHNSLAGAILQIAIQGISVVHQGYAKCPNGRRVGTTEFVKNVIWQGRNQSMHYEEGNYSSQVKLCFSNLAIDFGRHLSLGSDNLAIEVLDALGWSSYSNYESDMMVLLT